METLTLAHKAPMDVTDPQTRRVVLAAFERIQKDAAFRTLLKVNPYVAFSEVGIELPDREALQKHVQGALARQGITAGSLDELQRESIKAMMAATSTQPAAVDGASGVLSAENNTFYRGVPGYWAEAFWWGFHIPFSQADINDIIKTLASLDAALISLTATIIDIPGLNVAVPFLVPLIIYLFAEIIAIAAVQAACPHAPGLWISMAWIAPGIFVPTCI